MNKIFSVVKTLFLVRQQKNIPGFCHGIYKTIIQICMPFIGIILTPMIVDEICGEKNIHRLITLAAVLIVTECILGILQDGLNCQLSKYQERLSNYFTMQIGMHSMNLDFQLTEDKAALDQLDRAKTGMTWYSGGVYGIAEQVFMFFGNIFKIVGFITIIALNAPWMLLFITLFVIANSFVTAKCNKVDIEAFNRLSKVNRLFGYFGWTIVSFRYGKDVRLYDAKDMLVNRWRKNSQVSNDAWKWQGDTGFKYKKYSVLARTLMNLALYMYTGMLVVAAKITIGIFTQIIEASGALDSTLNGLIWNIQELIKKCNYAYEYVVFMEYPEAIEKNHDAVKRWFTYD